MAPDSFVQVYNPTDRPLHLGGWQLAGEDGAWTLPADTMVQPGRHLTITGDRRAFELDYGRPPDVSGLSLQFAPRKGRVELRDPMGQPVDGVAWGESLPGWTIGVKGGDALCRPDVHKDTNTHLDWQVARPAPGAAGCGGVVDR